jgi:phosphoenolpyruvate carboxykinase (diphosphate)
MTNALESVGLASGFRIGTEKSVLSYINLKLALLGLPTIDLQDSSEITELTGAILSHHREAERLLADYLCPADQRVQDYLDSYLAGTLAKPRLPSRTFVLDRYGLARILSLPIDKDEFVSDIVTSYRIKQGVLHNPKSDRRTTQGVFHIAEGGAPIPSDKLAVPREVFGKMLELALQPPRQLQTLPFTSTQREPAECFVSLLLRPVPSSTGGVSGSSWSVSAKINGGSIFRSGKRDWES